MFGSMVQRPVDAVATADAEAAPFVTWYDTLGLDSEYDYDPLWAKCTELGIAPTLHTGFRRQSPRLSPTNFTYNHIGHFATAGDAVCRSDRKEDLGDLFATPFSFGCEADDPMNTWAFDRRVNPFGARLNALFGSDIGHFDVPDMLEVLPEAYELVEDGHITAEDFRDFTFANAVRMWGAGNPGFFNGTVVEKAAAAVLAETSIPAGPAAARG